MNVIKVLLVDDHEIVRHGLSLLLSDVKGIQIISQASNGEEAVKMARQQRPDVVVMDVKMPGIGGLEATNKLLRLYPDVKIIVLTSCDEEPFPSRLLKAGAAGYLTKGCEPEEMIQAIRAVHVGQRHITPAIAQQLALRQLDKSSVSPLDILSERELQVLLMIAQGMKVPDIAEKLSVSSKTINSHRYRMFEKLKVENDVELTLLALRYGIIENETFA